MRKIIFILLVGFCSLCFADERVLSRDAIKVAQNIGLECKSQVEQKSCVVAYFDKNGAQPSKQDDAAYFRVLHGQTSKGVARVQDFYISGRKQTSPFVMRLDKNSLMSWMPVDMGVEGAEVYWAETGEKNGRAFFKNGVPDGLYVKWYLNGQKKVKTMYVDGKKHGFMRSYFENGRQKLVALFKNDVLNGFVRTWFEDGRVRSKIEYHNGVAMP